MAYIASNANRWYCAKEEDYGKIPAVTAAHRIPAVKLTANHHQEKSHRRDKTGSRTWVGLPPGMRRHTTFDLTTYMRDWENPLQLPAHGALIEAALGGAGVLFGGGTVAPNSDELTVRFTAPHGLTPGHAIGISGEIRFVAAVADESTVVLNVPLTTAPAAATPVGATATWHPAHHLPSLSLFDYWEPSSALQRVITGAGIDQMSIRMNGDFHEFDFRGMAHDLIDNASFTTGQGQLNSFPNEPAAAPFNYSPVPGNLGQIWLGVLPGRFHTVSQASIEVHNNLQMRAREYGSELPRGIVPGPREVTMSMELFSQDDEATTALYQAARQRSPLTVMFQLGQHSGQMAGIWLKSLIPDVPHFDDGDLRLRWTFRDTRAQGTADDEIVIAFG